MRRGILMRTLIAACLACLVQVACHPAIESDQAYIRVEGPTISPDGQIVVFNVRRRKAGGVFDAEVVLLNLPTRSTRRLLRTQRHETREFFGEKFQAPYPRAEGVWGFSWSPDGKTIFSTVIDEEGFKVWKFPVQDGKPDRICNPPLTLCQRPRVSPDGQWIVFYDDNSRHLFGVRPDGSDLKPLTFCGEVYRLGWDWSPDSRYVYFSRKRDWGDEYCELARVNADGSKETTVLSDYYPRYLLVSPSGRYIAFNQYAPMPDPDNELFIYRLGDRKPTRIAKVPTLEFSWHPRADVLLYASKEALYAWRSSTRRSQRVLVGRDISFPVITADAKTILFLKKHGRNTFLWKLDVSSGKTEKLYPPPSGGP